jgi:hypothetical protein
MDTITAARNLPILALLGSRVKKSRIPHQRRRDRTTVHQPNLEFVIGDFYIGDSFVSRGCQSTHSKPPLILSDVLPLDVQLAEAPLEKSRDSAPIRSAEAKILPTFVHDRCGYAAVHSVRGCKNIFDSPELVRSSAFVKLYLKILLQPLPDFRIFVL